ncbi:hypothetical protein ABU162_30455 [Paenibacillus thiaminolyticus]|uniref:hypothetical protein n=1 Tax=Paenibacillus thiaminolyticus TaxID=49283 RepID=UPI0035A6F96F
MFFHHNHRSNYQIVANKKVNFIFATLNIVVGLCIYIVSELLTGHPEQLLDGQHTVPVPSLHLLLVLTRLKEWQQRVQVSSEEAMRYFAQAHSSTITRDAAVKRLAHIHG